MTMRNWTRYHPAVLALTFGSYALLVVVRKTPSFVKTELTGEWTPSPLATRGGEGCYGGGRDDSWSASEWAKSPLARRGQPDGDDGGGESRGGGQGDSWTSEWMLSPLATKPKEEVGGGGESVQGEEGGGTWAPSSIATRNKKGDGGGGGGCVGSGGRHGNNNNNTNKSSWKRRGANKTNLFTNEADAEAFLGLLNATFLFVYALGLYVSGALADRLDLRLLLSGGMALNGLQLFLLGPALHWRGDSAALFWSEPGYLALVMLGGLLQSTGWPCVVAVMANWFGKNSRGFVLGLWSSCPNVGAIVGALMASVVVDYGYDYVFFVSSALAVAGSVLVFFGLVTSPREVGLPMPEEGGDSVVTTTSSITFSTTSTTTTRQEETSALLAARPRPSSSSSRATFNKNGSDVASDVPNYRHPGSPQPHGGYGSTQETPTSEISRTDATAQAHGCYDSTSETASRETSSSESTQPEATARAHSCNDSTQTTASPESACPETTAQAHSCNDSTQTTASPDSACPETTAQAHSCYDSTLEATSPESTRPEAASQRSSALTWSLGSLFRVRRPVRWSRRHSDQAELLLSGDDEDDHPVLDGYLYVDSHVDFGHGDDEGQQRQRGIPEKGLVVRKNTRQNNTATTDNTTTPNNTTTTTTNTNNNNRDAAINFFAALKLPGVLPYAVSYAFLEMVNNVFFFWLPFYLTKANGLSQAAADELSVWFEVGGVVGATGVGAILSLCTQRALVLGPLLALGVPALYVYGTSPSGQSRLLDVLMLAILGALVGGVSNIFSPAISADLGRQEAVRGQRQQEALSTVAGIIEGTGTLAAALGQVAVPYMAAAWGWSSVFFLMMAAVALSALTLLPLMLTELRELLTNRAVKSSDRCSQTGL